MWLIYIQSSSFESARVFVPLMVLVASISLVLMYLELPLENEINRIGSKRRMLTSWPNGMDEHQKMAMNASKWLYPCIYLHAI